MPHFRQQFLSLSAILLSLSAPAHAYLDPGTGSLLLQGLIAAIASVGFYAKMHWQAIKAYFRHDQEEEPESTAAAEPEEDRA